MFADDTKVYCPISDWSDKEGLQEDVTGQILGSCYSMLVNVKLFIMENTTRSILTI